MINLSRFRFGVLPLLFLTACGRIDQLLYKPKIWPEEWLRIQPYLQLEFGGQALIIVQPSTSAIVYLLGIITLLAGVYFLRVQEGQRSRLWWGVALLLWGVGALLAGTSYEAFSYQIKCAGRGLCVWTSWWEIGYLFVSAASVNAMLAAQAYACADGKWRRLMVIYAAANQALYTAALVVGSLQPRQFLISFELLLVFAAPSVVLFLIQNGQRYLRRHQKMDLALLGVWVWLALTIGAYFLYYLSGLTGRLWAQGVWFSENDVLHIGLIIWMLFIARIARLIRDN